jgi:hypothetical protein
LKFDSQLLRGILRTSILTRFVTNFAGNNVERPSQRCRLCPPHCLRNADAIGDTTKSLSAIGGRFWMVFLGPIANLKAEPLTPTLRQPLCGNSTRDQGLVVFLTCLPAVAERDFEASMNLKDISSELLLLAFAA